MTQNRNIELWESVCKTDPAHTKKFTKGGGFSGTAIKPFWLMRRATEVFGPCGISWGWTEIENAYRAGIWCSKVRLWYVLDGKRGEIEQWGQTLMEGTNKNGLFVDEEAPKKAVTDGVTKCLSYLGFAGDVHLGMFDDSKYVNELMKEMHGDDAPKPAPSANTPQRPQPSAAPNEGLAADVVDFKAMVAEAHAISDLNDFERKFVKDQHDRIAQYGNAVKLPTDKQMAVLKGILDKRKKPVNYGQEPQAIMSGPPKGHPAALEDEIRY